MVFKYLAIKSCSYGDNTEYLPEKSVENVEFHDKYFFE